MEGERGRKAGEHLFLSKFARNKVWIRSNSELRRGIQRVKQLIEVLTAENPEEVWLTNRPHNRGKRNVAVERCFSVRKEGKATNCGARTERKDTAVTSLELLPQPRLRKVRERKAEDHYRVQSASISALLSPHQDCWLFAGLKGGKKLQVTPHYEVHRRVRNENEVGMDGKAAVLTHRGELCEGWRARLAGPRPLRVRNSQGNLQRQPSPSSPGLRFQHAVARTAASMQKEQLAGWD